MNNVKDIIVNSLKYYDANNEKYSKILDKIKYYTFTLNKEDINHSIIHFYDKNEQEFFSSRYELLGIYTPKINLWSWGWAIPYLEKNKIYLSKKLLLYGIDMSYTESPFLKSELTTSRFKIADDTQLDIHAAIASYISKNPLIIRLIYEPSTYTENTKAEYLHDFTDNSIIWYLFLLDENGFNLNK